MAGRRGVDVVTGDRPTQENIEKSKISFIIFFIKEIKRKGTYRNSRPLTRKEETSDKRLGVGLLRNNEGRILKRKREKIVILSKILIY